MQQFTGIAFYSQALYFLGISGLPTALTFQLALGGFGVAMLGNIISWFIMNCVGKLPSFPPAHWIPNLKYFLQAEDLSF